MLPFTHVIFDWSGTLCDDRSAAFLATRRAILDLGGRRITRADFDRDFSLPAAGFYRRHGAGGSAAAIDRHYFSRLSRRAGRLFPGARETLAILAERRVSTSILSTLRQDLLEAACEAAGIAGLVGRIEGSVPDKVRGLPGHLAGIGRAAGPDLLFVGDTAHDLEAAVRHGLTAGCVLSGYHDRARLLSAGPRFVWNRPEEWPAFFASRPAAPPRPAPDRPVATVGALIENRRGEILLVLTHKWNHSYGIPGGKIEKGETAVAALEREIREETGLVIGAIEPVLVQDCIDSPEFHRPGSHFLLLNYTARTAGTRVRLNDEALSHLWIEPRQALSLQLNAPTRTLIETVLARRSRPSRRPR